MTSAHPAFGSRPRSAHGTGPNTSTSPCSCSRAIANRDHDLAHARHDHRRVTGCGPPVDRGTRPTAEHDVTPAYDGERRPRIVPGEPVERCRGGPEDAVGEDPLGQVGAASRNGRRWDGRRWTVVGGVVGRRSSERSWSVRPSKRGRRRRSRPVRRRRSHRPLGSVRSGGRSRVVWAGWSEHGFVGRRRRGGEGRRRGACDRHGHLGL